MKCLSWIIILISFDLLWLSPSSAHTTNCLTVKFKVKFTLKIVPLKLQTLKNYRSGLPDAIHCKQSKRFLKFISKCEPTRGWSTNAYWFISRKNKCWRKTVWNFTLKSFQRVKFLESACITKTYPRQNKTVCFFTKLNLWLCEDFFSKDSKPQLL